MNNTNGRLSLRLLFQSAALYSRSLIGSSLKIAIRLSFSAYLKKKKKKKNLQNLSIELN